MVDPNMDLRVALIELLEAIQREDAGEAMAKLMTINDFVDLLGLGVAAPAFEAALNTLRAMDTPHD